VADAAFRMIGRAIGARSVSGHGPSRIPGRHAGVSCRCLPPLLSIRMLRRRRRRRCRRGCSSLAMRRGATRTDGSRDDDEWFYEWTVRVGRESDESFPPAFPQRGVRRIPSPRVAARARPVFQEGVGTLYDSYDRDKAVPVTDESAGNGVLGKIVLHPFYRLKNIAARRLMYCV